MNKLLCIVGPTASGKTRLAVELSGLFPSILVSADSRQVYQGMDIVTGKDHPGDVKIAGIDIVGPGQESSVAVWHRAVMPVITKAWQENKLPIIVGGTGLYIKALTSNIKTMNVPHNPTLRKGLESLSVLDLQTTLSDLDKAKLAFLNKSDLNNPRRLVRAIEVASYTKTHKFPKSDFVPPDSLIIGLSHADSSRYQESIKSRVVKRIEAGAIKETQDLLKSYPSTLASFSSLGYKHIISYLDKESTDEELVTNWTKSELSYAKRQLTWFKKIPDILWFDLASSGILTQVAPLVKDWYSSK